MSCLVILSRYVMYKKAISSILSFVFIICLGAHNCRHILECILSYMVDVLSRGYLFFQEAFLRI